ncbi:hypothetical protein [Mangrovimonas spongiae]|uniref:Outer membrane protein beta-barrel domain-containing protein n=1 Tax=Mangrovimonas spongiae TaxID=2494697 RepID=A0A428K1H8_9FLAO|nr:hypothetical protein [Mangrovimonas spongiae]RSK40271.1 hypothetical protein EJA19_04645 [Mangrovimonas spongiae]
MKNKDVYFLLIVLFTVILDNYAQDQEKVITFSKGMWHTGITLSIDDSEDENIDNLLYNVIENERNGFEINVLGGYFVKEAMSVGIQYSYLKRERDLIYELDDNEARRQSALSRHTATAFLRNYFPISANNRFNFFNETDLSFGFGNSNFRHTKSDTDITKTFTDEYNLKLGVRPGISVILTKGFAFEVSLDLLGLTYSNEDVTKDGVKEGSRSDFNFDFDISLLSLDFGLAYYF